MRQLGYAGLTQDGDFYGYALALGSAEVTLWEQAQAYRVLARGGRWSAIHVQPVATSGERAMLPADASFIVTDILSDRAARTVTFGLDNHLNTSFWSAAKTGTSKDMRDNWCVGFSQRYTVAVWVGNFEGDSMHDVSGVTGAAPVWQEIMTALHAGWFIAGAGAATRRSCSGDGVCAGGRAVAPRMVSRQDVDAPCVGSRGVKCDRANCESGKWHGDCARSGYPGESPEDSDLVKGASASMTLLLNGTEIGPANSQVLWAPTSGAWRVAVADATGRVLDQILFTVR